MFCDTCHWYTAGEKICPHCGAAQKPKAAKDMFNLPGDVSVLDDTFLNQPLADAPVLDASALRSATRPAPMPVPPPAPHAARLRFCGRCGTMECIGARYCAKCGAQLPRPK